MIHLISIFTLVLVLMGASITTLNIKKKLNHELKSCISLTTKFNHKRKTLLNHLFSLNSKAKKLRDMREVTERAYQAAPPQAKAAAYAALQIVKTSQKIFSTYQQKILFQVHSQSYIFTLETLKNKFRTVTKPKASLTKPYPKGSDSPSYRTVEDFSDTSKVFIIKNFSLNKNLPIFFQKLTKNKKGFIECGSNMIFSENKGVNVKLLGGRSF